MRRGPAGRDFLYWIPCMSLTTPDSKPFYFPPINIQVPCLGIHLLLRVRDQSPSTSLQREHRYIVYFTRVEVWEWLLVPLATFLAQPIALTSCLLSCIRHGEYEYVFLHARSALIIMQSIYIMTSRPLSSTSCNALRGRTRACSTRAISSASLPDWRRRPARWSRSARPGPP